MENKNLIRFFSADIGKKNFAFYIEEFDKNELQQLINIPKNERYNEDSTLTPEMKNILDRVSENGKTILHVNLDLTKNCNKKLKLDPETFHNMNDAFQEYKEELDKCEGFIIEQQMKCNSMAMKLGQHCYSYFTFQYGRNKQIIEIPAYYKTQVFGAKKTRGKKNKKGTYKWKAMAKPLRKKWAINKAIEIITSRGDIDVLEGVTTVKKKDDLADCFLQLQAAKYLLFVEKMKL